MATIDGLGLHALMVVRHGRGSHTAYGNIAIQLLEQAEKLNLRAIPSAMITPLDDEKTLDKVKQIFLEVPGLRLPKVPKVGDYSITVIALAGANNETLRGALR
jgi:hypothetical protein